VVPENIHTPHGEFIFRLTPIPPGFTVPGGLHSTPPTSWNFHDFSTWVPLPLENSISTKNNT